MRRPRDFALTVAFVVPIMAYGQATNAKFTGFRLETDGLSCSSDAPVNGATSTQCSETATRVYSIFLNGAIYDITESNPKAAIPYSVLFLKHGPLRDLAAGTPVLAVLDGAGFMLIPGAKGKLYRYRIIRSHLE